MLVRIIDSFSRRSLAWISLSFTLSRRIACPRRFSELFVCQQFIKRGLKGFFMIALCWLGLHVSFRVSWQCSSRYEGSKSVYAARLIPIAFDFWTFVRISIKDGVLATIFSTCTVSFRYLTFIRSTFRRDWSLEKPLLIRTFDKRVWLSSSMSSLWMVCSSKFLILGFASSFKSPMISPWITVVCCCG